MTEPKTMPVLKVSFSYLLNDTPHLIAASGPVDALLGFHVSAFESGSTSLFNLIHQHDDDLKQQILSYHLSNEATCNLRLRHQDGNIVLCKAHYQKEQQDNHILLKLTLIDSKSLPRTLNHKMLGRNFNSMMENTSDYIFFKDRNHIITGASQALANLISPTLHWTDLIGKTDYDVFLEPFADDYYRLEKDVFTHRKTVSDIQSYQTTDGKIGWVDNHKYPILSDEQQLVGLFGIARDISEQKRIQTSLLEIADFVAKEHGEGMFETMTHFCAQLFQVDYVHIAMLNYEKQSLSVVAAHLDGKRLEPGDEYDLAETPCGRVVSSAKHCCYDSGIQHLFPNDKALTSLGAEAYIGEPIFDNTGKLIGLIVLVSRKPIKDSEDIVSGLRILAAKVSAEYIKSLHEHVLAASQNLLKTVIDEIPDMLVVKNENAKFIMCNATVARLYNTTPDEMIGKDDGDFGVPQEMADFFRQNVMSIMQRGETEIVYEDSIDANTGEVRHFKSIKKPFKDILGKNNVLVIAHDITDVIRAQEKVAASEKLLSDIIENLPIRIFWKDRDGRYLGCNSLFAQDAGKEKAEQVIGKDDSEMVWSANAELYRADDFHVMKTGQPKLSYEEPMTNTAGEMTWLRTSKVALKNQANETIGVLGVYDDITSVKTAEQMLKESEQRFRMLFETNRDAIITLESPDWLFTSANQAALNMFEVDSEQTFIRKAPWHYSPLKQPDGELSSSKAFRMIQHALLDGSHLFEWTHQRQNGETFLTTVLLSRLELDGKVLLQASLRDITVQKLSERALRLAANVFTHAREGIIITDKHACIIDVNDAFSRITGYSKSDVLGQNPSIFHSHVQNERFYDDMWTKLIDEGSWSGEIWNKRKDGSVFAELATISAVYDELGQVQNYIALYSDISALKEKQAQLERVAHYDPLTGQPNRLLLAQRLREAMTNAKSQQHQIAVAYLDLDGFKSINDNHGHEVGDELLIELAKRMSKGLSSRDTLARIGGDEFVLVLVNPSGDVLNQSLFLNILNAASHPIEIDDLLLHVTASLGVTFYPQKEDVDADQLLRQADQAMYMAKQTGKNRFHYFDAEQDRNQRGRHENLEQIRLSLANNEFELYYQPKVNMLDGQLIGVEALIRWQHPIKGLLAPGTFLPIIENHPISIEMGEWVIHHALLQITEWKRLGYNIPISVNVGALQLQHPDFTSQLEKILNQHPPIDEGDLELEILETSALEDFESISKVMLACQAMGVSFAVDDFGTGYSSLSYLKRLPAKMLKIDQSFVRDMLEDPDDLAILEAVLGLASTFHRKAIAEGVETIEHGERLLEIGCVFGQGYAIARPMPQNELIDWLNEWKQPDSWKKVHSQK